MRTLINKNLIIVVLAIAVASLLFILSQKKQEVTIHEPFDPTPYQDSIKVLKDAQNKLDWELVKAYNSLDSIKELPVRIIQIYEKHKATIPNATVRQLDSIIRTNI
jgi:hypothetical protein